MATILLTQKIINTTGQIRKSNQLKINTIFLSFCSSGQSVLQMRDLFNYEITLLIKLMSFVIVNSEFYNLKVGIICDQSKQAPANQIINNKIHSNQKGILVNGKCLINENELYQNNIAIEVSSPFPVTISNNIMKNNSRKNKIRTVNKMSKKIKKFKKNKYRTKKHRVFLKNIINKLGNKPKYSKRLLKSFKR